MQKITMRLRLGCALLLLSSFAAADIVDDVREAFAQNSLSYAQTTLKNYRDQHGADPAYLEALSWTARGALAARDYNQAYSLARQTQLLSAQQLKKRKLDAEPHLPVALGAAYEVESEVLAARSEKPQAILPAEVGASNLWQHFDRLPSAEEPQPAHLRRQTRSRIDCPRASWEGAGWVGTIERFPYIALLLGALVRGL